MAQSAPVKNVVLVHGAFAEGSSWSKVIPLLQVPPVPQRPRYLSSALFERCDRSIESFENSLATGKQIAPGLRRLDRSRRPLEQANTQVTLQITDFSAHARDRNAETARGLSRKGVIATSRRFRCLPNQRNSVTDLGVFGFRLLIDRKV